MDFSQFHHLLKNLSDKEIMRIEKKIVRRIGTVFLKQIRDRVKKLGLVDSKETLISFTKGKKGNIWFFDYDRNSITLEVGTAYFVPRLLNDGYTIHEPHFVPGHFSGGRFIHDPQGKASKSGQGIWMKPRTFIGRNYIDMTIQDFQGGVSGLINELLQKELAKVMK